MVFSCAGDAFIGAASETAIDVVDAAIDLYSIFDYIYPNLKQYLFQTAKKLTYLWLSKKKAASVYENTRSIRYTHTQHTHIKRMCRSPISPEYGIRMVIKILLSDFSIRRNNKFCIKWRRTSFPLWYSPFAKFAAHVLALASSSVDYVQAEMDLQIKISFECLPSNIFHLHWVFAN